MATIHRINPQRAAVDMIDMELAELDGIITGLRFMWENAEPAQLPELRDSAVALTYIAHDKIRRALQRVPQAQLRGSY